MIGKNYAIAMARYNLWQNENLLAAANALSEAERRQDRGSFFASIQQTFSHILWGDQTWMHRFAGTAEATGGIPGSVSLFDDWSAFEIERQAFDHLILNWAREVGEAWFDGDLSWFSGAMAAQVSKPRALLVMHMFNHQSHHRGQIHAMLTAAGSHPGDTDIPFMPERYSNI